MSATLFDALNNTPSPATTAVVIAPLLTKADMMLAILRNPDRFGATPAQQGAINAAAVAISQIVTNQHVNNQKTIWIYQQLARS